MILKEKNFQLVRLIIRVAKENSAFLYFTLESNEGLCFYSTIESSLSGQYRDLELVATLEFEEALLHLIENLTLSFPVEILLKENVIDHVP